MHPVHHALAFPDKAACVIAETGAVTTYRQLDQASNRGAHLIRSLGLRRGDVMAAMLDNEAAVFDIAWAAQRAGIYLTSISTKLVSADTAYILKDSGAKLFVVSDKYANRAIEALEDMPEIACFTVSQDAQGLRSWNLEKAAFPATPIEDESPGTDMLYSSGTTGRPKGVKPPLPDGALDAPTALLEMGRALYDMNSDSVYLSTSPLYHAAPLRWAITVQRLGGTVVVMERFDAERALQFIEAYRITHSTWVPTHFIRMLKLPVEVRSSYDFSSLKAVIHAAAPCPVPVKQAMIDWWGPIIYEYYSGTETCGITALSSEEWLSKPGSVGKAVLGAVKILDANGDEVNAGQIGDIYFADGPKFEYHNDPDKTAKAYNAHGWATLGDIGYLDEDGYLYLKDRKNFMIISGGVNIYPQEIENCLVAHPKIFDVAVIGVPDDEMGEIVVAVVQLAHGEVASTPLIEELASFARLQLGSIKTPRKFEFREELPRQPTGKLLKSKLIEEYRNLA